MEATTIAMIAAAVLPAVIKAFGGDGSKGGNTASEGLQNILPVASGSTGGSILNPSGLASAASNAAQIALRSPEGLLGPPPLPFVTPRGDFSGMPLPIPMPSTAMS